MIYPVRVSMILPLLQNVKDYECAHVYKVENDLFIDVNTRKEANLIARLNGLQEESYKVYQEIINLK